MKNPLVRKPARLRPVRSCPHCGASMPAKALACPECGSDEHTGWKPEEDIQFEALDLGDPIPDRSPPLGRRIAIVLLAAILLAVLSFGWIFSALAW